MIVRFSPRLVVAAIVGFHLLLPNTAAAVGGCEGIVCDLGTQGDSVHATAYDIRSEISGVDGGGSDGCPGCRWKMVIACAQNSPVHAVDNLCTRASQCAEGTLFQILLMRPGEPWTEAGRRCLRAAPPQGTGLSPIKVREEAVRRFGSGRPSFQPPDGGIVNVPTIFSANQAGTAEHQLSLLGQALRLTGTARWHWDFGDGTALDTHQPGGAYPDASVTHTYTRPGRYTITLTTTWTASYAFNGAPPQPVPGAAITATAAPLTLQVRQARSQLTGG